MQWRFVFRLETDATGKAFPSKDASPFNRRGGANTILSKVHRTQQALALADNATGNDLSVLHRDDPGRRALDHHVGGLWAVGAAEIFEAVDR